MALGAMSSPRVQAHWMCEVTAKVTTIQNSFSMQELTCTLFFGRNCGEKLVCIMDVFSNN